MARASTPVANRVIALPRDPDCTLRAVATPSFFGNDEVAGTIGFYQRAEPDWSSTDAERHAGPAAIRRFISEARQRNRVADVSVSIPGESSWSETGALRGETAIARLEQLAADFQRDIEGAVGDQTCKAPPGLIASVRNPSLLVGLEVPGKET